jgi:hypothetical protein
MAFGMASGAMAQVPPDCPNVCNQKYALCIAASCDPKTGKCGECDKSDGSCGYCYVFEGQSCSYNKPCKELEPSGTTVYSTYSERLSTDFGFKVLQCDQSKQSANCMDGRCTLTGQTVSLGGQEVPTAICQCQINSGGGGTLGGSCNQSHCAATWSVAGSVLNSLPHCEQREGEKKPE